MHYSNKGVLCDVPILEVDSRPRVIVRIGSRRDRQPQPAVIAVSTPVAQRLELLRIALPFRTADLPEEGADGVLHVTKDLRLR